MELWDAYYDDGTKADATLRRGEPIPEGLNHLVCSILVRHADGTYLLMRRHPDKTWGGVFEASAGGCVLQGETPLEAARRELQEETGIAGGELLPIYEERWPKVLYHGFLCETDSPKDAVTLQAGETTEYRWVTEEELRRMHAQQPRLVVIQPGFLAWLNGEKPLIRLHPDKRELADRALDGSSLFASNSEHRPIWHLAPLSNWMNDPNGCIFFRGQYHAFFQCNPHEPVWNSMHWAHAVSDDLLNWRHLPMALAPDHPYDDDPKGGCFSGSAIEKDGKLWLMYTATKDGKQRQCVAVSDDGVRFEKYAGNPVIPQPPAGHSHDFRDPKVLKVGDLYYVLIGSSIGGADERGEGCAVLYRSPDLLNWTYVGIAARSRGQYGTMWECPDLFELDGKWVMTFCPMHMDKTITHYFVGQMNFETGVFLKESEGTLDRGWEYYAPQTFQHTGDRRIQLGWQGYWDWMPFLCSGSTLKERWRWSMAVPREIWLDEKKQIRAKPVQSVLQAGCIVAEEEEMTVNGEAFLMAQDAYTCRLSIAEGSLTLWPRGRAGEDVFIRMTGDVIEVGRSVFGMWDVRTETVQNPSEAVLIVDRNAIEVFADEGRLTFSCCDYGKRTGLLMQGYADVQNFEMRAADA